MNVIQALILGIVQGLTEYLPVSSSAHLVMVPAIFGWHFTEMQAFVFDVLVQLGTLVGVIWFFWADLWRIARAMLVDLWARKPFQSEDARMGWFVGLATIPAAVIGLAFKDEIAAQFSSPKVAAQQLLVTAAFLIIAEFVGKQIKERITVANSLGMGFAQALALLPGISRSGSTIAAGMCFGLTRTAAARFSFLMSIPAMVGASIVAGDDLVSNHEVLAQMWLPVAVGFVAAAISGYLVIRWFLHFLQHRSLVWFAAYCIVAGVLGWIYL